ncbi:MAG: hypothetical protein NC082_01650 [Clostridiales bacterium]|nr:hypothetical protein [Clostridiales bacterium]
MGSDSVSIAQSHLNEAKKNLENARNNRSYSPEEKKREVARWREIVESRKEELKRAKEQAKKKK